MQVQEFSFNLSDVLKLLPELMLVLLAVLVVLGDLFAGNASDEDRFREAASTTVLGLGLVFIVVMLQGGFLINRIVSPELEVNQVGNAVGRWALTLLRNLQSVTDATPTQAGTAGQPGQPGNVLLNGALLIDPLLMISRLIFIGSALITALLARDYAQADNPAEFYGLLVFATIGLNLMAGAGELITLYLSLELASVSLYIMAGYFKREPKSSEAGIKYYIFGALSSGILLYGMSLLYGYTAAAMQPDPTTGLVGSPTSLSEIVRTIGANGVSPILLLALIFIISGVGYKLAVVPFHAWSPDVYQGAPTPVTAFLSTASKTAGFVMLFRIMVQGFGPLAGTAAVVPGFGGWASILGLIAFLTMSLGNFAALTQTNVKRLLAYSSIAHAGFLLIGMTAIYAPGSAAQAQAGAEAAGPTFSTFGMTSLVYYLISYTVMNLGAFGALATISRVTGGDEMTDLQGLHRRNLPLAAVFAFFVLSLAGIPPLSGYWAKFFVFQAGWESGALWLVIAGLLNTVISLYYYLRILKAMFFGEPLDERRIEVRRGTNFSLIVTAILVLVLGLAPQIFLPAINLTQQLAGAVTGG